MPVDDLRALVIKIEKLTGWTLRVALRNDNEVAFLCVKSPVFDDSRSSIEFEIKLDLKREYSEDSIKVLVLQHLCISQATISLNLLSKVPG